MRGRIGRPTKSAEFRRTAQLRIRLTEAERTELDKAADGDVSTWAREILLQVAKKRNGEKGNRTRS